MIETKKYKQVIIVNKELKMPAGKMAAQVAHASCMAYLYVRGDVDDMYKGNPMRPKHRFVDNRMANTIIWGWTRQGYPKVVLQVKNEEELKKYFRLAQAAKITSYIVCDEGRTQLKGRHYTACAIGPWGSDKIDEITKDLKLY